MFKNKAEIKASLVKNLDNDQIKLESATTGRAAVTFWVERNPNFEHDYLVRCNGFATPVEHNIFEIDELVDYLWQERKRIIY